MSLSFPSLAYCVLLCALGPVACSAADAGEPSEEPSGPVDPGDDLPWGGGKADSYSESSMAGQLDGAFQQGDTCGCANASALLPPFDAQAESADSWQRLETDHFFVLYRKSGKDRVAAAWLDLFPKDGHPDFVNEVAKGAEQGHAHFVGTLGFPNPGKTTIYVKEADGYFGYMSGGTVVIDNDSLAFKISRHFLRATVAHEYFHVVQAKLAGSWTDLDRWFTESSAVWAEQEATNLWGGFVGAFVRDTVVAGRLKLGVHESLLSNEPVFAANLGYSTFLWEQFLVERHGDKAVIKRIFELMAAGHSALSATDAMLVERGSSLEHAFREWTSWNYLVGSRDDGQHYSDGDDIFHGLASSHVERSHADPPADWQTTTAPPALLGANYVEFDVSSSSSSFTIEVEGEGKRLVGLTTLAKRRSDGKWITTHHAASTTTQNIGLDAAQSYSKIVLVVQHLLASDPAVSQKPMSFRYRASES